MPRASERLVGDRPRYRHISTRMWGDEKFRKLSKPDPNAQSLWVFLLTGPHTQLVPGLFDVGEAALVEMLGWSLKGFRRAWRELADAGMVQADWSARVVWIPNALRHNPPASPNVVRGWRATLDDLPECPLKVNALAAIASQCDGFGEGFRKAFREGFPEAFREEPPHPSLKTLPNQDQDQDQEQEQEGKPDVQREGFARFWSRYPRQQGRDAALEVWNTLSPDPAYTEQILAGLERWRGSSVWVEAIETGDPQFVLMPEKWLRRAAWTEPTKTNGARPAAPRCPHTPRCPDDPSCTVRYLRELHTDPDASLVELAP